MAQVKDIQLPDDLHYDPKDHLWSRVETGRVRIGLDQFGQKAAGTVAYIKLLPAGKGLSWETARFPMPHCRLILTTGHFPRATLQRLFAWRL